MYCIKCGKEIESNSRFCIFCGVSTENNPGFNPGGAPVPGSMNAAAPIPDKNINPAQYSPKPNNQPAPEPAPSPMTQPVPQTGLPNAPGSPAGPVPVVPGAPFAPGAPVNTGAPFAPGAPVGPAMYPYPPAGDAPAPEKKKKTGLVILIIALVLALLTGGFCVYWFVLREDDDSEDGKNKKADTTAVSQDGTDLPEDETDVAADISSGEETTEPEETSEDLPEHSFVNDEIYPTGQYVISVPLGINLRADSNKNSSIVESFDYGEKVTVTEVRYVSNSDPTLRYWGKATKNGKTGWLVLFYASFNNMNYSDEEWYAFNMSDVWDDVSRKTWKRETGDSTKGEYTEFYFDDNGNLCIDGTTLVKSGKSKYTPGPFSAVIEYDSLCEGSVNSTVFAKTSDGKTLIIDFSEYQNNRISYCYGDNYWVDVRSGDVHS